MKIQKYTKTSISIILTLLLSYGLVSAWTNLSSVTNGDQLTATVWNDMVTKLNDAGQRASGIFTDNGKVGIGTNTPKAHFHITNGSNYGAMILGNDGGTNNNAITHEPDGSFGIWNGTYGAGTRLMTITSGGNVGIGNSSPGAKLEVSGDFIRTIARASGISASDLDSGQIPSRVLNITKKQSATSLRINYTDNFRVLGPGKACTWEIKVDGVSCSTPLYYSQYTEATNHHSAQNVLGYCNGVTAGAHQIQVWVSITGGYTASDCYTGWNTTWALDAEEVN